MLKKIYAILDQIRSVGIFTILGLMICIVILQIILRYFTGAGLRPYPWGDEVVRLSSLWVVFLAASLGVKEEAHLSVTAFIKKVLPNSVMFIVQKLAIIIVIITLFFLVYHGYVRTMANTQTSLQNLDMSVAWFYAALPVGCFYLLIDFILILIFGRHPFSNKNLDK